MPRYKHKPMPQTIRDQPGSKFMVLSRTSSFAAPATRQADQGWKPIWIPTKYPAMAVKLTKAQADHVLALWQARPEAGRFEYKVVPDTVSQAGPPAETAVLL
jgi:hypothetical protein